MKKLILCCAYVTAFTQAMNAPETVYTFLTPQSQIRIIDPNAKLTHAVQNGKILSVLYLPGAEFTRIYTLEKGEYTSSYSGRMLPCNTPLIPEVVKRSFSCYITQYCLQDKTVLQILASCKAQ